MTIAFTTAGPEPDAPMDARFGRTRYLQILDPDTGRLTPVDNAEAGSADHGAGPRAVQLLVELGADVLITGNGPGGKAAAALAHTGIRVFIGAGDMSLPQAREAYAQGELREYRGA